MQTPRSAASTTAADHTHDVSDLAMRWPMFNDRELNRLRFLAYRRQTGRIRPSATVRADVDALCADLFTDHGRPAAELSDSSVEGSESPPAHTPSWLGALGSVPPTFAARRDWSPGR